jgi:thioredoxin reductase
MGSIDQATPPNNNSPIGTIKSVAVIGAGISGVSAAAHLLLAGFEVTVFERGGVVGGVWQYDSRLPLTPPFPNLAPPASDSQYNSTPDGLTADEASIYHASPSPCYAGLRNNIFITVMRSSLLEWPEGTGELTTAEVVRAYIEDIARQYDVLAHTQLWTKVEKVSKKSGDASWSVRTSKFSQTGDKFTYNRREWTFDAVIVATGHYDVPRVPDIPGLAAWHALFPDRVTHSKSYRDASPYKDSTVLLVGAGTSSSDIAMEVHAVGGRTYQVTRDLKRAASAQSEGLPESCERVRAIKEFKLDFDSETQSLQPPLQERDTIPGRVVLEDGQELTDLHYVIVCTGYVTTYPFLGDLEQPNLPLEEADEEVIITSDGYTVHNLHKDIFYIPDPTLAVIGVQHNVSTFSLFDFQARVVASVYKGYAQLLPKHELQRLYRERKAKHQDEPEHKFHALVMKDVTYAEGILEWVNAGLKRAGQPEIVPYDEKWYAGFEKMRALYAPRRPDLIPLEIKHQII